MTQEAQNKIWKSLGLTFALGIVAIIIGLAIYFLGLGRKLVIWQLCAFVFGGLAVGMSLYKMVKFKKFLKSLEN